MNQYEQLSEALAACGRDDIVGYIYDVKQKFEPGTTINARQSSAYSPLGTVVSPPSEY